MWVVVRKIGAIGIFYKVYFGDVTTKDEWFAKYSNEWELHHFCGEEVKSA